MNNEVTARTRVKLEHKELAAIQYLKKYEEFKDLTNSQILKTAVMIVAIDAASREQAIADKAEQDKGGKE